MAEETISFELIRKIQRQEQRIPKLTKLPENFYQSVGYYLQQKRKLAKEGGRFALETKNIERLVEDVFNRRERKILNMAIIAARTGSMPENLTDQENNFFDSLVNLIKTSREGSLDRILTEKKEEVVTLATFKEDTPQFIGSDMKTYGPFKKGDIAKLPEDNMRVLLERGVVEEFKVSK